MSAAEKATEVVADVAEEVGEQAYEVADISRGLSGRDIGLVFGGVVVGAGIGGAAVYFFASRRLETKFSKIADDEIEEMRVHFEAKVRSLEAQQAKGDLEDLEEIVTERGYSTPRDEGPSPMAVTPPQAVVEEAKERLLEEQPADAKVIKEPEVRNVFAEHGDKAPTDEWDMVEERKRRSPDTPYVIHIDERSDFPDYDEATLTYYEADDVLCNERDEIVDPDARDALIGERSLNRFGHGSGDPSIVWVRNDRLELQYEIVKSPNSYAEEVHGFQHHSNDRRNLERMRSRERRLIDDD